MLVNKNRKYSKNNKFGKENEGQSEKGKEGPRQATNLANLAKETRILPATTTCLLTKTANIARITK